MADIDKLKYIVCCPLCDNKKCVKGTDKCEAEQFANKEPKTDGDCINREAVLNAIIKELCIKDENYLLQSEKTIYDVVKNIPSVSPQEPKTKALGEELRSVRNGIKDENVLIGYNMAVAICNKYLEVSK